MDEVLSAVEGISSYILLLSLCSLHLYDYFLSQSDCFMVWRRRLIPHTLLVVEIYLSPSIVEVEYMCSKST